MTVEGMGYRRKRKEKKEGAALLPNHVLDLILLSGILENVRVGG